MSAVLSSHSDLFMGESGWWKLKTNVPPFLSKGRLVELLAAISFKFYTK